VFVEIIKELEICHIYKMILLTIEVATRNVFRIHRNHANKQPSNKAINKAINNIIQ
jgi:hypothetical protein